MNVLVVAAHPDDEILGCGATIARHAAEGCRIETLILAEGATARDDVRNPESRSSDIESLRAGARAAAEILGAAPPRFGGLPDNRLDGLERLDITKIIEAVIAEVRPEIVYTHHGGDLNLDHRIAAEAVATACRPLPNAPLRAIYAFETVSSSEWGPSAGFADFKPTRFVDVTDHLRSKRRALACYGSEICSFPHARSIESIEALARWRGASVGFEAAEAFEIMRELNPMRAGASIGDRR